MGLYLVRESLLSEAEIIARLLPDDLRTRDVTSQATALPMVKSIGRTHTVFGRSWAYKGKRSIFPLYYRLRVQGIGEGKILDFWRQLDPALLPLASWLIFLIGAVTLFLPRVRYGETGRMVLYIAGVILPLLILRELVHAVVRANSELAEEELPMLKQALSVGELLVVRGPHSDPRAGYDLPLYLSLVGLAVIPALAAIMVARVFLIAYVPLTFGALGIGLSMVAREDAGLAWRSRLVNGLSSALERISWGPLMFVSVSMLVHLVATALASGSLDILRSLPSNVVPRLTRFIENNWLQAAPDIHQAILRMFSGGQSFDLRKVGEVFWQLPPDSMMILWGVIVFHAAVLGMCLIIGAYNFERVRKSASLLAELMQAAENPPSWNEALSTASRSRRLAFSVLVWLRFTWTGVMNVGGIGIAVIVAGAILRGYPEIGENGGDPFVILDYIPSLVGLDRVWIGVLKIPLLLTIFPQVLLLLIVISGMFYGGGKWIIRMIARRGRSETIEIGKRRRITFRVVSESLPEACTEVPLIWRATVRIAQSLKAKLKQQELHAVIAHEVGHVARDAMAVRVARVISFILLVPRRFVDVAIDWTRRELEADRFAVELTKDPASLAKALRRMVARAQVTAMLGANRQVPSSKPWRLVAAIERLRKVFWSPGLLGYAHAPVRMRLLGLESYNVESMEGGRRLGG